MIYSIVLAAGQSRRMGRQKLLLPWGGTTIIGHIVDQLLHSVLDGVLVVTGCDQAAVIGALSGRPVTFAHNPDTACGMLSSVRCGVRALPPACDAVLVALGDQPMIETGLVDRMVTAFQATDKRILVPLHQGKRGHPLVFSSEYCHEILTQYDDTGLRGLLQAHPQDLQELAVSTPAILGDIDRPEDYQRQRARFDRH